MFPFDKGQSNKTHSNNFTNLVESNSTGALFRRNAKKKWTDFTIFLRNPSKLYRKCMEIKCFQAKAVLKVLVIFHFVVTFSVPFGSKREKNFSFHILASKEKNGQSFRRSSFILLHAKKSIFHFPREFEQGKAISYFKGKLQKENMLSN